MGSPAMSATDQSTGGAMVSPPHGDSPHPMYGGQKGATYHSLCMKELHHRLMGCKSHLVQYGPMMDHKGTKKHAERMWDHLHKMLEWNRKAHEEHFPEHHDDGEWDEMEQADQTPGEHPSMSEEAHEHKDANGVATKGIPPERAATAEHRDAGSLIDSTARHGLSKEHGEEFPGAADHETKLAVHHKAYLQSVADYHDKVAADMADHAAKIRKLCEPSGEAGERPEKSEKSLDNLTVQNLGDLFKNLQSISDRLSGAEEKLAG